MERYGRPLIIVDIGTATTFDAIDAEGAYQGGAIFPGLKVAMEALFLKASKLPRVDIEMPEHAIGKTTVRSMQSGAVRGYVGALTGIITDIQKELGGRRARCRDRRHGPHDGGILSADRRGGPESDARGSASDL